MSFGIMTLSVKGLYLTLSINDIEHNNALHYAECHYAECYVDALKKEVKFQLSLHVQTSIVREHFLQAGQRDPYAWILQSLLCF
jgi:hypothetical protein